MICRRRSIGRGPETTSASRPARPTSAISSCPAEDGRRVYITIRTAADGSGLPRAGQRVLPAHSDRLAKLKSPNSEPALRTAPRAHHWRMQLLEFLATADAAGDIVAARGRRARRRSDLSQVPHDLVIDRCYIHGDPARGRSVASRLTAPPPDRRLVHLRNQGGRRRIPRRSPAGTAPGLTRSRTTTSRRPARTSCSAARIRRSRARDRGRRVPAESSGEAGRLAIRALAGEEPASS